jgi:hypothetical protein
MFGNSMEAHHLLYAYLLVWFIQGGYAAWIVWQWTRTKRSPRLPDPDIPTTREDS